jgi:molecular chaperone GrpE (heat shock protein)
MLNTNKPESDENECKVPENNNTEGQDDFFDGLLEELFASIKLDNAHKICALIKDKFEQFNNRFLHLLQEQQKESDNLERYWQIVADCQKQTAAFANNQFEKNALHPAIETVDSLTLLIEQIHDQTTNLSEAQIQCPLFKAILNSVAQAAQVAQAKRQYLDIEHIKSEELDDFDPNKHEIMQAVETNENSKHKKIKETLVPGLIYRGKVLRQAKVSIYRYSENQ